MVPMASLETLRAVLMYFSSSIGDVVSTEPMLSKP